jgi:hypothetical protein
MKKFAMILFLSCMIFLPEVYSQTGTTQEPASSKPGQNLMFNDLYFGYAAGSLFYFTGRMNHSDDYPTEWDHMENGNPLTTSYGIPESFGTLFLGFGRNLNRVVSWGFMLGFQNFSYTETATEHISQNGSNTTLPHTIYNNDILLTGIARVLFSYVNKPNVRMYSGVGLGIMVDFGRATMDGNHYGDNKLWPGGQLTFMGIRYGRAFGGFFEFGFGSYGIINAGLSYKFAD